MSRKVLDPVAEIRSISPDSSRAAMLLHRIILNEGEQVVSLHRDGKVYATPPRLGFSQRLMKGQVDCVVGQYKAGATSADIREDLIATWNEQRSAA